ncbi:MAG TPA: hypothetical protein VGS80_10435 [Ktedonobacterales bacterium]|nr:hypothetical protein [Ktedonobacterales bacterium]
MLDDLTEEQWHAAIQWALHRPRLAPAEKYALVKHLLDQRGGDDEPYGRYLRQLERQMGIVEADTPH